MKTNEEDCRSHLMETLTYELPVLRTRLGLSQQELAEKVGISRQTYNSIENGNKKINWLTFNTLIAVFKSYDETETMLRKIDGFEEELLSVIQTSI